MNIHRTLAQKARGASGAARSYFGLATSDNQQREKRQADRVSSDTEQADAKVEDAFER
ncbi:MAG: hypothetical protein WCE30_12805 [Mycobacterium sp.]